MKPKLCCNVPSDAGGQTKVSETDLTKAGQCPQSMNCWLGPSKPGRWKNRGIKMAEEQMAENETSEEGGIPMRTTKGEGLPRQVLAREQKFKETWWKRAEQSEKLYSQPSGAEGEKYKSVYNILYSNTRCSPEPLQCYREARYSHALQRRQTQAVPEVIERFLMGSTPTAPPLGRNPLMMP